MAFFLRTQKIPTSSLAREAGYPDTFSESSSVHAGKCWNSILKYVRTTFFHILIYHLSFLPFVTFPLLSTFVHFFLSSHHFFSPPSSYCFFLSSFSFSTVDPTRFYFFLSSLLPLFLPLPVVYIRGKHKVTQMPHDLCCSGATHMRNE